MPRGPGKYFVFFVTLSGSYASEPKEIFVQEAVPATAAITSNAPVANGATLVLSAPNVAGYTYTWTLPNATTVATRVLSRANYDDAMAGIYTLTTTPPAGSGCVIAPQTIEIKSLSCDVYLKATLPTTGIETYTLPRKANVAGQFDPLLLTITPFEGTQDFAALYNISWYLNGNPAPLPAHTSVSVATIGAYEARLSLKANPATICVATANLNALPCKTYTQDLACAPPGNIELPPALAEGIPLAPGDKFTTGDYTVVVTEITSGGPTGYNGKGYIEFKFLGSLIFKQVSVLLKNTVVNSCYQHSGGKIETEYDPNWKGVVGLDPNNANGIIQSEAPNQAQEISKNNEEILEIIEIFTCSNQQRNRLIELIDLNDKILEKALTNEDYSTTQKSELQTLVNSLKTNINNILSCCVANARLSSECINPSIIIEDIKVSNEKLNVYPKFKFYDFTFEIIEELHLNTQGKSEYYYFLDLKALENTKDYATFKVTRNGFQEWEIHPVQKGNNVNLDFKSYVASDGKLPLSQSWNNFLFFFPGLKVDDYWYMGRLLKYLPEDFVMPQLHNKWIALFNGAKAKESTAEAAIYYEILVDLPELGYLGFSAYKNFKISKKITATAYKVYKNVQSKIASIPQSVRNILSKTEIDELIQDAKALASAIAQPQAFIDGKNFEKFILNLINILDNAYYNKVLAKIGIDLRNYIKVEQVQIWIGNKWIIADNVFYKEIGRTGKFEAIINECKLGSGTALSDNQDAFLNAIASGQRKFKVRSLKNGPVGPGEEFTLKGFFKTYGPEGSYDIIKLF